VLSALRARPFLVLGMLLLLLAGCVFGLDTKPGMTVQQSIFAAGEALSGSVRAAGGNGTVIVSGRIIGKLPCDVVRGGLKEGGGGDLEITITLEATRACPGNPPTSFNYLANIVAVEAGPRSVRVEHRFVGTDGPAGVVLDTMVTVN
jgi:hypothetical protein